MDAFIFGYFYFTEKIKTNVCEKGIEIISYDWLLSCHGFSISEERGISYF